MLKWQKTLAFAGTAGAAVLATGCGGGAYRSLDQEIQSAVAAARPDTADSATAAMSVGLTSTMTPPVRIASPATVPPREMPAVATTSAAPGTAASSATPTMAAMPMSAPAAAAPAAGGRVARAHAMEKLSLPSGVAIDTLDDVVFVAGGEGAEAYVVRFDTAGRQREARWLGARVAAAPARPATTAAGRAAAARAASGSAMLKAPRGLAIVADTVWVADETALRGFHRRTGAAVGSIDLSAEGATLLSDVTVGGDGALYVTDAAVTYSARGVPRPTGQDRIYRVDGRRRANVALETPRLGQASAIAWDAANTRFLIAPQSGDTIFAWRPGTNALEPAGLGAGPWEGIVATDGGAFLAVSRSSGAVYRFQGPGAGTRLMDLRGVGGDLAHDRRRGRLVIAMPAAGRVEVWEARR